MAQKMLESGGTVDLETCEFSGVLTHAQNRKKCEFLPDFFFERRDRPRLSPQRDQNGKIVSRSRINLQRMRASIPRKDSHARADFEATGEKMEEKARGKKNRKRRLKNQFEREEERAKERRALEKGDKKWYKYVTCLQPHIAARNAKKFDFTTSRYRAGGETKTLFSDGAFHKHAWPQGSGDISDSDVCASTM